MQSTEEIEDMRSEIANEIFEDYDFDSNVAGFDGWEYNCDLLTRAVFLNDDDYGDGPSYMMKFSVRFMPDSSDIEDVTLL